MLAKITRQIEKEFGRAPTGRAIRYIFFAFSRAKKDAATIPHVL